VGISTGIVEGALGFGTLQVHPTTDFRHPRNILAEIWYGTAHEDFPPSIWIYLSRPEHGTRAGALRDDLLDTWRASRGLNGGLKGAEASAHVALYFGAGGRYDADELEERAQMLLEVRDMVDLMNHDLRQLASDVSYQ
jgi:hypothetical protein